MEQLKEQNYLSLVLQLHAKTQNLTPFLTQIDAFFKERFDYFEYILVNNQASPAVLTEAREFFKDKPKCKVQILQLPYLISSEQAILSGIEASIGDFVFEFENNIIDFQVQTLFDAYQACLTGVDIVLVKPQESKKFFSNLFYTFLNSYSFKDMFLTSTRFHLLSRRAINRINMLNEIIHYRKFAYCSSGLKYNYLEYQTIAAVTPSKKEHSFDFATDLLLLFTDLGKKATLFFTVLFAGVSLCSMLYTILIYFLRSTVPGWATTMFFMSLAFTGVFLGFTITIKYLNLILKVLLGDHSLPVANKERL